MILIGICDNDCDTCNKLKKLLIQYSMEKNVDLKIQCFLSAEEFCKAIKQKEYQIVFINIVLKEKNGMEVGVELRRRYPSSITQLIYISDNTEYSVNLFQNQPFYFLNQPFKEEVLKVVMDCWWRDFGNENHLFWYRQGSEWKSVFIRQILYFRQEKRRIYVVTKTGEDWFYAKWEMIQERLKGHKFFFCHQSYFIHQNYVVGVTNTKLMMENGEEIPISRSKQKEIGAYMSKYK